LPPMSNGMRVQFVSIAMIFIVSSRRLRLRWDCAARPVGQQCLPTRCAPP
jgi:hypothetical protein